MTIKEKFLVIFVTTLSITVLGLTSMLFAHALHTHEYERDDNLGIDRLLGSVQIGSTTAYVDEIRIVPNVTYLIHGGSTGITDSGYYIAGDLDDTKDLFVHEGTTTGYFFIMSMDGQFCTYGAQPGVWEARIGFLLENDATDGTVHWFNEAMLAGSYACGSAEWGFNHSPVTGEIESGNFVQFTSFSIDSGNTLFDNDDTMFTLDGNTLFPAPGDIIIHLEEISGNVTIGISFEVSYYIWEPES